MTNAVSDLLVLQANTLQKLISHEIPYRFSSHSPLFYSDIAAS